MASVNNNLNKRIYSGVLCDFDCPFQNDKEYLCDLYGDRTQNGERCKKCIKDIVPNSNAELISLMKKNNELLKELIVKIDKL